MSIIESVDAKAINHPERSDMLREAMGDALFEAILAVRRGEAALFAGTGAEEIAAHTRWRW